MEKNVKRIEVVELYHTLKAMDNGTKYDKWFTYAVTLTESKIKNDAEAILAANIIPEEYMEFEGKRQELLKEYAIRDDSGEIIVNEQGQPSFNVDDVEELNGKIKSLSEDYSDTIETTNKEQIEFEKFLNEYIDVEISTLSIDKLPEELTKQEMKALLVMVEE